MTNTAVIQKFFRLKTMSKEEVHVLVQKKIKITVEVLYYKLSFDNKRI